MNMKEFMDRPITWGDSFKVSAISAAIGLATVVLMNPELFCEAAGYYKDKIQNKLKRKK